MLLEKNIGCVIYRNYFKRFRFEIANYGAENYNLK